MTSSQDFVRALRATSDPPFLQGPTKLELARRTWDDITFHVPEKARVIAEWILSRFVKDKSSNDSYANSTFASHLVRTTHGESSSSDSLLDSRYWALLRDVISNQPANSAHIHPSWLVNILNRLPLATLVSRALSRHASMPIERQLELFSVFTPCIKAIWQIPAAKMTAEQLLDCAESLWSMCSDQEVKSLASPIGSLIMVSYRRAFVHSPNKKKLYSLFLQKHLLPWLTNVVSVTPDVQDSFHELLLGVGFETLFSLDALRQTGEFEDNGAFFQSLRQADFYKAVQDSLSILLLNFTLNIRKHRGPLYGQGAHRFNGNARDHLAALQFLSACLHVIDAASVELKFGWRTRRSLMAVAEGMNLLVKKCERGDEIIQGLLHGALEVVRTHSINSAEGDFAIDTLAILARIDFNPFLSFIPQVVSAFILNPQTTSSANSLLKLSIDYHSKTRTLDSYITTLLGCLKPSSFSIPNGQRNYANIAYNPVISSVHLHNLAKAVNVFLPANQLIIVLQLILQHTENLWDNLYNLANDQSDNPSDIQPSSATAMLTLSIPLACTILASLPFKVLPESLNLAALERLDSLRAFVKSSLKKTLEYVSKIPSYQNQLTLVALLKLQYTLETAIAPFLEEEKMGSKPAKNLLRLDHTALEPVLVLEIYRTLLLWISLDKIEFASETIDAMLLCMESCSATSPGRWINIQQVFELGSENRINGANALLHLVCQRWLHVIEVHASEAQLGRFVLLLRTPNKKVLVGPGEVSSDLIVSELLHTASFWEFHRLGAAVATNISSESAILENIDLSVLVPSNMGSTTANVMLKRESNKNAIEWTLEINTAARIYEFLLIVPIEYIPRPLRSNLVKRAFNVDLLLHDPKINEKVVGDNKLTRMATAIRMFLFKAYYTFGLPDKQQESSRFIHHLITSPLRQSMSDEGYTHTTIQLMDLFLGTAIKGDKTILLRTLELYQEQPLQNELSPKSFLLSGFIGLVRALLAGNKSESYPEDVLENVRAVLDYQTSAILPNFFNISSLEIASNEVYYASTLSAWRYISTLRSWLDVGGDKEVFETEYKLGQKIGRTPAASDQMRLDMFAIILLQASGGEHRRSMSHWEWVVATYVTLYPAITSTGQKEIDESLGQVFKTLSVDEFSIVTSIVLAALQQDWPTVQISENIIQFALVLQRDQPPGTMKTARRCFSSCISIFCTFDIYSSGPPNLGEKCLKLVAQYCSEKPSFLHSTDVSAVFTLISKFLHPSTSHHKETSHRIFHAIIAIISAMLRLRRDLIALTLPHLGMVLQQIISTLKFIRPNLGAKQSRLVTDTQPIWLNANHPLSVEGAKVFSRLLETLTIKTTPRRHTLSTEIHRGESLSKTFSKHAIYVLKAYVEAINDPLCTMPPEVNRELKPGLLALCSMVNEHSRDALMVSGLDAGGKIVLKNLWRDYHKQRYAGQG